MTEILFARLTDIPSASSLSSGTFTPGVAFGAASVGVTYSSQVGFYTKLGSRVFFNGRVLLSSKGSSVGAATITGLPFASLSTNFGAISIIINASTAPGQPQASIGNSASVIALNYFSAGNIVALDNTHFGNTTVLEFSGSYVTT
jgi:hypothetical protein